MTAKLPKKLRKEAANLVRLATKVLDYRQDLMPLDAVAVIEEQRDALANMIKGEQHSRPDTVKGGIAKLEKSLKPHGGSIYPVTFWGENIEILLVAAILAIGIRTFFFQPFKIPTNSMYPTYAGMTETVYDIKEGGPNSLEKAWNFVTLGAVNYADVSAAGGEVLVPVSAGTDAGTLSPKAIVPSEEFMGRKWFGLLPAPKRRYVLYVSGEPVVFEVPVDFRLDEVIRQTYFSNYRSLYEAYQAALREGRVMRDQRGREAINTGHTVAAGEDVLDFDIDTGDMLFVDRFTYNFFPPKVGQPIVFRTEKILGLEDKAGNPAEQYYIKRLVGLGGDTLKIEDSTLLRNGSPISGAEAFFLNSEKADGYAGYTGMWRLRDGMTDTVPEGYIYAMGDNSPESYDSRGWGFGRTGENLNYVPEKEVIGKAFFIFYPFSKRWGLAE